MYEAKAVKRGTRHLTNTRAIASLSLVSLVIEVVVVVLHEVHLVPATKYNTPFEAATTGIEAVFARLLPGNAPEDAADASEALDELRTLLRTIRYEFERGTEVLVVVRKPLDQLRDGANAGF